MNAKTPGFSKDLNLKKLLDNAHIGVVIHSWDTSVLYANPVALRLLRLSRAQILGKIAYDPQWHFVDESGRILSVDEYPVTKVKQLNNPLIDEVVGVVDSSDDTISWFLINAYVERGENDTDSFVVVTFNDITDKKQLYSFEEIVENTQDLVIITEASSIDKPFGPKIVYVNKAFETLTGYTSEEVIGETPRILQGALTDKNSTDRINKALKDNQAITETLLNYDKQGRPYWIEMNIMPLTNKFGEVTNFVAIERDVSEKKFHIEQLKSKNEELKALKVGLEKRVEERTKELMKFKVKLEQIAFIDQLTNIPNRRYFIDQAQKVIHLARRNHLTLAFGFIDVDNFKTINDQYGHVTGDTVLKVVANRLAQSFRTEDAFCRHGGEEFAFVVAVSSKQCISKLGDRLLNEIRNCSFTTENDDEINITVSIGLKVTQVTENTDLESEIKDADNAMYQAKKAGKDRYMVF